MDMLSKKTRMAGVMSIQYDGALYAPYQVNGVMSPVYITAYGHMTPKSSYQTWTSRKGPLVDSNQSLPTLDDSRSSVLSGTSIDYHRVTKGLVRV